MVARQIDGKHQLACDAYQRALHIEQIAMTHSTILLI